MCGIAGLIYNGSPEEGKKILQTMTGALAHRGPDSEGIFQDKQYFLGHRRLSIIDLSARAAQPMTDPGGRFTIVFNGEIYNYKELKNKYPSYAWKSNSDGELVLAAWAAEGKACLDSFAGMFAFAIYDKENGSVTLVRDRFGVKPIYYTSRRGHFVFSSEIRSILKTGLSSGQINSNALQEYLTWQSVSPPETLVEGVFMLGPGEILTWKQGVQVITRWWNTAAAGGGKLSEGNYEQIKKCTLDLLRKSISRRMVADVPVAAFLSGGIDSSAVVALMAEQREAPVETFSVVFNEKDFDESRYSGIIAKKYNTRHHPILLSPHQFLKAVPDALAAMDHPSGDGPNSFVVSGVTAKAGIKVALSGIGGDEIFAGYPFFRRLHQLNKSVLLRATPGFAKKAAAGMFTLFPGGRRGAKIAEILRLRSTDLANLFPAYRVLFSPAKINELIKNPQDIQPVHRWLEQEKKNLVRLPLLSQVSVAEIHNYLHNVLLRDTDQMSMAHSLEVREPFLDHELAAYVFTVPDNYKLGRTPKKLLVDSLGNLLPPEIVFRKKMGFTFPWAHWLRNELSGWCEERINRLEARAIFKVGSVRQVWERFRKKDKQVLWNHVWLLVVLEEWMEQNGING